MDIFDFKKGVIFGGLSRIAIGAINYREGLEYAFSSGGKEAGRAIALGSLNMGLCRKLATGIEDKTKALFYGTLVPTAISVLSTYGIHEFIEGTPHPIESTAPSLLSIPLFFLLAIRERRLYEKRGKNGLEDDYFLGE